jgi:hypothetical protein
MGSMVELLKALAGVASADVPDKVSRLHARVIPRHPARGVRTRRLASQMPAQRRIHAVGARLDAGAAARTTTDSQHAAMMMWMIRRSRPSVLLTRACMCLVDRFLSCWRIQRPRARPNRTIVPSTIARRWLRAATRACKRECASLARARAPCGVLRACRRVSSSTSKRARASALRARARQQGTVPCVVPAAPCARHHPDVCWGWGAHLRAGGAFACLRCRDSNLWRNTCPRRHEL